MATLKFMKNNVNQLTDLEIVKVFRYYPLAPVAIYDGDPDMPVQDKVEGVVFDLPQIICERASNDPRRTKLILKQIRHIDHQDIIDITRLYDNTGWLGAYGKTFTILPKMDEPDILRVLIGGWPYSYTLDKRTGSISMYKDGRPFPASDNQLLVTQAYCDLNYAVPLYFGVGHWANNKTAFDLGIAIPDRQVLNDLLNKKFEGDKTEIGNWWLENEKLNINDLTVMDEVIERLKAELNV